jgi:hypothetical protein
MADEFDMRVRCDVENGGQFPVAFPRRPAANGRSL